MSFIRVNKSGSLCIFYNFIYWSARIGIGIITIIGLPGMKVVFNHYYFADGGVAVYYFVKFSQFVETWQLPSLLSLYQNLVTLLQKSTAYQRSAMAHFELLFIK